MAEERKKRDYALLLLLLLLLSIACSVVYYSYYPYGSPVRSSAPEIKNKPRRGHIIVLPPEDSLQNAETDSSVVAPLLDTASDTRRDTTAIAAVTTNDTGSREESIQTEPSETARVASEEEIAAERLRKKEFINVSAEDDIVCLYDPIKKNLYFHPSRKEWANIYLIYPSPDAKSLLRRNLIYPDFTDLIYPVYRKGDVVRKGTRLNAVSVKVNAKANTDRSYIIQTKSDPPYLIFGDYEDKNKWYIYENGKVRKFTPPADFDALITEKL